MIDFRIFDGITGCCFRCAWCFTSPDFCTNPGSVGVLPVVLVITGHGREQPSSHVALAKAISYVFQVPLPKLMRESKSANYFYNVCRFPAEDIPKIQSQVDGADMKCLSEGTIPLWVLLFMANSPRFPYTLHVSRTSDDVAYYDFILKRELLIPKPTKEI